MLKIYKILSTYCPRNSWKSDMSQKLNCSTLLGVTVAFNSNYVLFNDRDQEWANTQKMGAFVSVSQGGPEPLRFMEIEYKGSNSSMTDHFALVGKGVTFDT